METFRAFLFSLAIFAGLAIIALLVAVIMRIVYSIIHHSETRQTSEKEKKSADTASPGKVG